MNHQGDRNISNIVQQQQVLMTVKYDSKIHQESLFKTWHHHLKYDINLKCHSSLEDYLISTDDINNYNVDHIVIETGKLLYETEILKTLNLLMLSVSVFFFNG